MFDFNKEEIIRYYQKIKRFAFREFQKGNYNTSIDHIDSAAILMYNLNLIYTDAELEELMRNISKKVLPGHITDYQPVKGRFVFYDQIGNSTVLGLQYVRALISWGVEFLYILEPSIHTKPQQILSEVGAYPGATTVILDQPGSMARITAAYEAIAAFRPEKAFLHAPAEGAAGVVLWNALNQIKRYRIVPGDHHYYLGTSVTDYAIEFRPYGVAVALQKRGFESGRVLEQPYYPIVSKTEFQGFPKNAARDRVVMFSGGALYKTYGRDGTYFKIIKRLLDENPTLVILYAGGGVASPFLRFIEKNNYRDRFIILEYRNDLSALFEHIDIYLGTYPLCGGLMSQYAAYSGKPIVQYNTHDLAVNSLDGILDSGQAGKQVELYDLETLFSYAKQLIDDKSFREQEGARMKTYVITPEEFNSNLRTLISAAPCPIPVKELPKINYEITTDYYLEISNRYIHSFESVLLNRYRLSAFRYFPKAAFKGSMSKVLWKKAFRKARSKYKPFFQLCGCIF